MSVVFPRIMEHAQRIDTAEFLAEFVSIVPLSFLPPFIKKLDININKLVNSN